MSDTKTLLSIVMSQEANAMSVTLEGDPAQLIALIGQACAENYELSMVLLLSISEMIKKYRPEADMPYLIPMAGFAAKLITEAEEEDKAIKNLIQ